MIEPIPISRSEVEESIRKLLVYIGEDPGREGLKDTPVRVVNSWTKELFSGYNQDPSAVFKVFQDGACDQMVILKGIEFWSSCEHHILPFFGHAHIAYIPDRRVIGISKLARLLEIYTRRLQIQERIGQQITAAIDCYLKPLGSACVLEAQHFCVICRGVQKQRSVMITSSLTGQFLSPEVRAEFLSLIKA